MFHLLKCKKGKEKDDPKLSSRRIITHMTPKIFTYGLTQPEKKFGSMMRRHKVLLRPLCYVSVSVFLVVGIVPSFHTVPVELTPHNVVVVASLPETEKEKRKTISKIEEYRLNKGCEELKVIIFENSRQVLNNFKKTKIQHCAL